MEYSLEFLPLAAQPYCYKYPHPAVTADIVIFTLEDAALKVVLIERDRAPHQGAWALPGGFVQIDEDLEAGARRELQEEAGVADIYLEQVGAFGQPGRDPRERVITVAYYALAPRHRLRLRSGSDARRVGLFPYRALPELAFDHAEIIASAHRRLQQQLRQTTLALAFLPPEFTLRQLQQVHETILDQRVDKRVFYRWARELGYIERTGRKDQGGQHRPAELYRAAVQVAATAAPPLPMPRREQNIQPPADGAEAYEQGYRHGYRAALDRMQETLVRLALDR